MSDKQREEFEKWAKEKGCSMERHNDLNQESLDWYAYDSTDLAWESWQAAITSMVVKLPPRLRGIDENCRINNRAVDMIQRLLTEVGISYE